MLGSVYSQLGQFDKAAALMTDIRRNFDRVDNKAQFNATLLLLGDKLFNAGFPVGKEAMLFGVKTGSF